jgi:hypothetical protein
MTQMNTDEETRTEFICVYLCPSVDKFFVFLCLTPEPLWIPSILTAWWRHHASIDDKKESVHR